MANKIEGYHNSVIYKGKRYRLRTEWPYIIAVLYAMESDELSDSYKILLSLDIIIASKHPNDVDLLEAAFEAISSKGKNRGEKKTIDIIQDWGYIYAGFYQAYRIDLYKKPQLHWIHFCDLLACIPSDTRIAQIIEIRQMEIPKPTKYNSDEIARIAKLKARFSIKAKSSDPAGELKSLFNVLYARAQRSPQINMQSKTSDGK